MRILGLMTGTSVDSADFALVDFRSRGSELCARIIAAGDIAWPHDLRARVLEAVTSAQVSSLARFAELDADVGEFLASVVGQVCTNLGTAARPHLVVSPGQTLYHHVVGSRTLGTITLGDPARIYAATQIPVLSHVRTADIALGGTGAPLAPLVDQLLLGSNGGCLVNIGGIANATVVPEEGVGTPATSQVRAGDSGPGNGLIDAVAYARTGVAQDINGALAAQGNVHEELLAALLADPYFTLAFPKSTGREYFSPAWLNERAAQAGIELANLSTQDLLATVTQLSARSLATALVREGLIDSQSVHITGGGAHNPTLMRSIAHELPHNPVTSGHVQGLDPDIKEAFLMAVIGYFSANGWPANVPSATGASKPAVLGMLSPPHAFATLRHTDPVPNTLNVEDSREHITQQ